MTGRSPIWLLQSPLAPVAGRDEDGGRRWRPAARAARHSYNRKRSEAGVEYAVTHLDETGLLFFARIGL